MKILCVAEKNDAAKNIATQLRPSFINLIGVSQTIAILESDLGDNAFQKMVGKILRVGSSADFAKIILVIGFMVLRKNRRWGSYP